MTIIYPSTTITVGTALQNNTIGDRVVVLDGVTIGSTGFDLNDPFDIGAGIYMTSVVQSVVVQGTVSGVYGIVMGDDIDDGGHAVSVQEGGLVLGEIDAILFAGAGTLENAGEIVGGVLLDFASGDTQVVNRAAISAAGVAISVLDEDTSTADVVSLSNGGTITSLTGLAYDSTGNVSDRIVNRGVIEGGVTLGDGADRLDDRGGRIEGAILGEAGSDVFLPGAFDESIDGGTGNDTLDFRGSAGLRVSLADDSGIPTRASRPCWARAGAATRWSAMASPTRCAGSAATTCCRGARATTCSRPASAPTR